MAIIKRPTLPVIISGTGPAALLLAHSLLRSGSPVPFQIYERDPSMTYRAQGYRFTVKDRGVISCQEVLSSEHFALLRATCGDGASRPLELVDPISGTTVQGKGPAFNTQQSVEPLKVDRTLMRSVLFRGLEPYTIFGRGIVGYEIETQKGLGDNADAKIASEDEKVVIVRFDDGSTQRASLLVGADGAYSKIRAQLQPETKLLDTELRMIFGKTPLTPVLREMLDDFSKHGQNTANLLGGTTLVVDQLPEDSPRFFMCDAMHFGSRAVAATLDASIAATLPEDYIYWAVAWRKDRSEVRDLDWHLMTASMAADMVLDITKSWSPSIRALIMNQDRSETLPSLSVVSPGPLHDWRTEHMAFSAVPAEDTALIQRRSNHMVTLIGDAAHAMPPTGGSGATTALTDAAILGTAISDYGVSLQALNVYEAQMRKYGTDAVEKSLLGGKMFLNMRGQDELHPLRR